MVTQLPTLPRTFRGAGYRAVGIGGGQFGLLGKHTGAGPPSDFNFGFATTVGIGGGQFGLLGKHTGAGPPSENAAEVEFFEAAIPDTAPKIISPASAVVAIDFMANLSPLWVPWEIKAAQCTALGEIRDSTFSRFWSSTVGNVL